MLFSVISASHFVPTHASPRTAFLCIDNCDDWGKYRTMFTLVVVDDSGTHHDIGSVNIGEVDLKPSGRTGSGQRAPELPETFDALDSRHFSLGQSEDCYASLNRLDPTLRRQILTGLRDCAYDLKIFEVNFDQEVMGESLLRDVYAQNVRGRLYRLAQGNAQLTEFRFAYTNQKRGQVHFRTRNK